MSSDLERLRQRLYLPGASEQDLADYRAAVAERAAGPGDGGSAAAEPDGGGSADAAPPAGAGAAVAPPPAAAAPPPPVAGSRRRRRAAVGLAAAGASALALAVAVTALRAPAPGAPTPGPSTPVVAASAVLVPPPILVRSSAAGLSSAPAVQKAADTAFRAATAERRAAVDGLARLARGAALPGAADRTLRDRGGGLGPGGIGVVDFGADPTVLEPGSVLLLTVVSRRPTVGVWEVFGWRSGEPRRPYLLAEVRPLGEVDRLLVGALRVPDRFEVTQLRVRSDPASTIAFRWELHAAAACAGGAGTACTSTGAG